MMRDDLFALYAFNRWADGRVVEKIRQLSPEQYVKEPEPGWASIRATVVHMAGATDIWARRIQGETVTVRPTEADVPTLEDAERYLAKGHDAFNHLLTSLSSERLASIWSYRNFQGEEFRLPLWAVLRHVVNHASYHRGQIASKLKRFGVEPPSTDFVFWAIEQTPQA
jgi:uncharacterized damage-inducible protein DinB